VKPGVPPLLLLLGLLAAPLARAQDAPPLPIHWRTEFVFYGDNTEFTHFFRVGETILGAQFQSYLEAELGPRTSVRAGVFADHRSGADTSLDPVKPILSFRYRTATSLWVLGTLETHDRHGYLEPLEVTTLELTRPIEEGLQWVESRKRFHADVYLNWQHLNTSTSREIFDYGGVISGDVTPFARLEGQLHGLHHGGQLYDVGPVTNNVVYGPGVRLHHDVSLLGEAGLAVFQLFSTGKPDPAVDTQTISGHGTYVRCSVSPLRLFDLFAIWWRGKDFITNEGDHNYGSPGLDNGFYLSDRHYQELGAVKKFEIANGVTLDGEVRLHRIEGRVEYSYRFVVHAPFDLKLR
jgi:hypothetical protein